MSNSSCFRNKILVSVLHFSQRSCNVYTSLESAVSRGPIFLAKLTLTSSLQVFYIKNLRFTITTNSEVGRIAFYCQEGRLTYYVNLCQIGSTEGNRDCFWLFASSKVRDWYFCCVTITGFSAKNKTKLYIVQPLRHDYLVDGEHGSDFLYAKEVINQMILFETISCHALLLKKNQKHGAKFRQL